MAIYKSKVKRDTNGITLYFFTLHQNIPDKFFVQCLRYRHLYIVKLRICSGLL